MFATKKSFSVIGLMSGTSLDGVDIAYCHFSKDDSCNWSFSIEFAETIPYTSEWLNNLKSLETESALKFIQIDREYGTYLGKLCKNFISKYKISPNFIASHGHTIFHQPHAGYTVQIGLGANIAASAMLSVVSDFRSVDVALGGQGAPLVPIGDKLLFKEYDFCLNLGGFANISYDENNTRIAFDICPVNMALNYLAGFMNMPFDESGRIAKSGKNSQHLFNQLNNLSYYTLTPPKSLGKEWFDKEILPLISTINISLEDRLNTYCNHIAFQIAKVLKIKPDATLFVTGGGTFNDYLINCIKAYSKAQLIIPNNNCINFKEALIFAFLGVLRMTNEYNCLKSVTGALKDNIGGAVYQYKS